MYKKLLTVVFSFLAISAFAAPRYGQSSCPKFYIGLSTGIDNQSGFLGVNFDVPVTGHFSLGTGLGLGTWGFKTYGEGRFYFKECNRGWALGAGVTYATGLQDFVVEMPTTAGTNNVLMDLEPVVNATVSGYRFFSLGDRHRFHLQLGWSQRFNSNPYTIKSGDVLTSDGNTAMNILAPGGLVFAFGFTFGLGGG